MKTILSICITILYFSTSFSQGMMYSASGANNIYGPVLESKEIQSILLQKYFAQSNGKLMFRISDNTLIILNGERVQLYPGSYSISENDVFRVFSTALIYELIQSGGEPVTLVELRNNGVISITNGNHTLEYGDPCPPVCP